MSNRKCQVLIAIQQALLGEVTAKLRAVTVDYGDTNIHLNCYYDQEITDADMEAMSCVETELIAVFPETHVITYSVIRSDYPALIPKDSIWVFLRKEGDG